MRTAGIAHHDWCGPYNAWPASQRPRGMLADDAVQRPNGSFIDQQTIACTLRRHGLCLAVTTLTCTLARGFWLSRTIQRPTRMTLRHLTHPGHHHLPATTIITSYHHHHHLPATTTITSYQLPWLCTELAASPAIAMLTHYSGLSIPIRRPLRFVPYLAMSPACNSNSPSTH